MVTTGGAGIASYIWKELPNGNQVGTSQTFDPGTLAIGTYQYYVEISFSGSGCDPVTSTIAQIDVGSGGCDGCIEIPTGFTPNGDGIHDEWNIYGLYHFSDVLVKIFNRWGQQVFESNGYNVPWDGKYNGKDLPNATYYYIIELTDSGKIFNGTVTIKR